jgi:Domain of unknown function (DUF4399)
MQDCPGRRFGVCGWSGLVSATLLGLLPLGALGQTPGRTPSAAGASVYFIDLKDGATVPEKFTIRFGLRNMGLAPAGMAKAGTGHHHVLVDADMPPADRPIPNDPRHLHFGAGQTEAEVTLAPGQHTLQLLFADHEHVPHDPPIASDRIRIVVQGEAASAALQSPAKPAGSSERKASPPDAAVYFVYPQDGAVIYPTSTIRFGLAGMGVAPAGTQKANTGHHHLLVDVPTPDLNVPIPNTPQHLHFGAGQTEMKLTLPPGEHVLQLILGDENHLPHDPPVASDRIKVLVRPGGPGRS